MITNRRELNKINSRKRILKASRKLFTELGYENTMLEDIAESAEVSKGTIYNYFPNKESLLIGTVNEVLERVTDLAENQELLAGNSLEKLKLVLLEIVAASVDYLNLSRRIGFLNSCEDSPLYATRKEMLSILRGLVIEARNEGRLKADGNIDDIVDLIMGIYLIALFEWSHIEKYSPEFLKEKLYRFFNTILSEYLQNPGA